MTTKITGQGSAKAWAHVQLLYVSKPLIWDWKIFYFENTDTCLALHFLMSCKTTPLAVLHLFYPICINTGQRHVTAVDREKSNSSVPKQIFYNSSSTLLLIPKNYATSSQNQVIAQRTTKVTSSPQLTLNFSNALLNCELNSCLQAPEYTVKQILKDSLKTKVTLQKPKLPYQATKDHCDT